MVDFVKDKMGKNRANGVVDLGQTVRDMLLEIISPDFTQT